MIITQKIDIEEVHGEIKIDMPRYMERLSLVKEVHLERNDENKMEFVQESMELAAKMEKVVGERIKEVSLKLKGQKTVIDSLEHLECYSFYPSILGTLFSAIVNGVTLGKPKEKALETKP